MVEDLFDFWARVFWGLPGFWDNIGLQM